ncbi:LacI family transcriptional regulator [Roseomonas sp. GC11]|uniref:LacI family DNA-binding transcriptional regulator n=1 Tax=Roseomonas sp. GC11 TaxID=2950546 RepID=UPI00210A707C|nr:LacI family DNA-binding transcriptional regulator [Roseomonas sp. GC11]MCQ4162785.1 LacI family transcriptional regulator [Roseomonas sp. GC11]
MADIARLAGVSVATVSRAMAGSSLVSQENKERVASAVRQTGYVVNQVARGLRLQRSGLVLVMVPSIANPFFAHVLLGIEEALQEAGFGMLVANTGDDHAREDVLARSMLTGGKTEGLILLTGHCPDSLRDEPQAKGRIVAVSEEIAGQGIPSVTIDNAAAMREATAHLIGLGHRRIAHLAGPAGNGLTVQRLAGFHAAMREAGLPVPRGMVGGGAFTIQAGEEGMSRLLARQAPPTAVVCANDEIAIGAIKAARERGIPVPAGMSVVGFDDIDVARAVHPGLTTIRQPRQDLGREAARMLLALLAGEAVVRNLCLPTQMILRASTAPPS